MRPLDPTKPASARSRFQLWVRTTFDRLRGRGTGLSKPKSSGVSSSEDQPGHEQAPNASTRLPGQAGVDLVVDRVRRALSRAEQQSSSFPPGSEDGGSPSPEPGNGHVQDEQSS